MFTPKAYKNNSSFQHALTYDFIIVSVLWNIVHFWSHFKDGWNKCRTLFAASYLMWLGLQLVTTMTVNTKKCAIFQNVAFSIFHCLAICHSIAVWFNKKYISLSFNGYYCLNKNMFEWVTFNACSRKDTDTVSRAIHVNIFFELYG